MSKIQGEGDYISGQKYQEAQHRFAQEGPVEAAAREAADALSGPEAKELEAARRATAKGHAMTAGHEVAKRERSLDETLDDSFPASDPAPTSPGSD
jgi:hypothetical protein